MFKMYARYADGTEHSVIGKNEEYCIGELIAYHDDLVYYTAVTDENFIEGEKREY